MGLQFPYERSVRPALAELAAQSLKHWATGEVPEGKSQKEKKNSIVNCRDTTAYSEVTLCREEGLGMLQAPNYTKFCLCSQNVF